MGYVAHYSLVTTMLIPLQNDRFANDRKLYDIVRYK